MLKFSNALYIMKSLMKRGPRFLFVYFRQSLMFDLVNGTNTHLRVPKQQAAGDAQSPERRDGLLYVASLTNVVRDSLRAASAYLGESRFNESQFLDLGCGKGKAVLVYAKEFSREARTEAVGIEYDPHLHSIATDNLNRVPAARARAQVHCDSALNFEQYIGRGPLIVYLYNSFQGETLRSVLGLLAKHEHVLIYVDPAERPALGGFGYRVVAENQSRYNAGTWLLAAPGS